jgi:hypothetical protein
MWWSCKIIIIGHTKVRKGHRKGYKGEGGLHIPNDSLCQVPLFEEGVLVTSNCLGWKPAITAGSVVIQAASVQLQCHRL